MPDDVPLNKVAAIERALRCVGEEYAGRDANLFDNTTEQDAIVLNLHVVRAILTERLADFERFCERALERA